MLKVNNLTKIYKTPDKGLFTALKETSFNLDKGETLAILGDSGSGKSTLGQIIAGLIKATSGEIYYNDELVTFPMQKKIRKDIQILFQHPEVSFNPKLKIYPSMKEPYELYVSDWNKNTIIDNIEQFGLREAHLDRYPHELSGGELQRLSIARMLVTNPKILILDEPTSMLDVMSQAQILNMLKDYQKGHDTSFMLVTHDSLIAEKFADRILHIESSNINQ